MRAGAADAASSKRPLDASLRVLLPPLPSHCGLSSPTLSSLDVSMAGSDDSSNSATPTFFDGVSLHDSPSSSPTFYDGVALHDISLRRSSQHGEESRHFREHATAIIDGGGHVIAAEPMGSSADIARMHMILKRSESAKKEGQGAAIRHSRVMCLDTCEKSSSTYTSFFIVSDEARDDDSSSSARGSLSAGPGTSGEGNCHFLSMRARPSLTDG